MKLYFLLVRRVPPVPSPILLEVFDNLRRRRFEVEAGIAEEMVQRPDRLRVDYDLYLLKSHTELSLTLAGVLHAQGARILNPYPNCLATQNKIVASRLLRAAGVPTPPCWVTGDLRLLRPLAEQKPLILKPYLEHRGRGLRIVRNPRELEAIPPPDTPVLVQEFIEGTGEDLKLYVVGEEVFAVRKKFSPASFTQPGQPCPVSEEMREITRGCGQVFGLGLYGVDIVEDSRGFWVIDVNAFPGYKGVPRAAPLIADYIEGYATGRLDLSANISALRPCRKAPAATESFVAETVVPVAE